MTDQETVPRRGAEGPAATRFTFAEELLILTVDAGSREPVHLKERTLHFALAGAVLMDLALQNRIDTDPDALFLIDPTPLENNLLDPVLREIADEPNALSTEDWMTRIARRGEQLRSLTMDRLVAADILQADDGGDFALARWVTHSGRYPRGRMQGAGEQEIQTRMMAALLRDDIPSPRDSVIISLAHACGVFRSILDASEYDDVKDRIEAISRMELVLQAVTKVISNMTLAESLAMRRVIGERGGGWPTASGRLPVLGHVPKLVGNLGSFFTEQYLEHGPVFELNAFGNAFVVIAGTDANQFVNRNGRVHLRTHEHWREFTHAVGAAKLLVGLTGEDHKRLRRTKRKGYSRNFILDRLPQAFEVMERELAALPTDRPVSVVPFMRRVMTEQITVLTTGTSSRDHLDDIAALNGAMTLLYVDPRLKFVMRTPRMKRVRRRLELLIEQVLAKHESAGEASRDLIDDLVHLHRSAPEFMPETDLIIAALGPFMVGPRHRGDGRLLRALRVVEAPWPHRRSTGGSGRTVGAGVPHPRTVRPDDGYQRRHPRESAHVSVGARVAARGYQSIRFRRLPYSRGYALAHRHLRSAQSTRVLSRPEALRHRPLLACTSRAPPARRIYTFRRWPPQLPGTRVRRVSDGSRSRDAGASVGPRAGPAPTIA